MPIDFAAIANYFSARMHGQTKPIADLYKVLGKWLTARQKTLNALEVSSRRFPVVVFERGALAVAIDSSQRNALQISAPPTFLESLAAGGRDFVDGFRRIGQAVEEERILPNLFAMLSRVVTGILNSIERFSEPQAQMFVPGSRRAGDLFGLFGMAYRSVVQSGPFMYRLATQDFRHALGLANLLPEQRRRLSGESGAGTAATAQPTLFEQMDNIREGLQRGSRYILGAILLLPLLPGYIHRLFQAGWLRARVLIIDTFQGVERLVFSVRRRVIDLIFETLPDYITKGLRFLEAFKYVIVNNLIYFARFGLIYGIELTRGFITFSRELTGYMQFWINLLNGLIGFFNTIMNFDLMTFIVPLLGIPATVLHAAGVIPSLTLGDILDATGHMVRVSLHLALTSFINGIRTAVLAMPGGIILYARYFRHRLNLAQQVINALFQRPGPYPAETAAPVFPAHFPNIFRTVFGTHYRRFAAEFQNMGRGLAGGVGDILTAGSSFLINMSDLFQRSAAQYARLGSPEQYQAWADLSDTLGDVVYGPQISELQGRLSRTDPVETAFIRWFSQGGFEVIGAAIPLYIEEMQRYWEREREEGRELTIVITPTSPHILARRVRLGRVRMQRLDIDARSHEPDQSLAGVIAQRFKSAVEQSYVNGFTVLQQVGGSAP